MSDEIATGWLNRMAVRKEARERAAIWRKWYQDTRKRVETLSDMELRELQHTDRKHLETQILSWGIIPNRSGVWYKELYRYEAKNIKRIYTAWTKSDLKALNKIIDFWKRKKEMQDVLLDE